MLLYIIGRAGASPPSRTTGLNFLYNYMYIIICIIIYIRSSKSKSKSKFMHIKPKGGIAQVKVYIDANNKLYNKI